MGEVLKNDIITALQVQLDRVTDLCVSESVLPGIKVHELRKCFKRLNAFLKLFPTELQSEISDFRKPLREMARRLTMARESTVNLELFERLNAESKGLEEELEGKLKEKLSQVNQNSLEELLVKKRALEDILDILRAGVEKLLSSLYNSSIKINHSKELKSTFEKASLLYLDIQSNYDAEHYHKLRKQMKTLYYQSELVHQGQLELPGSMLERLHAITDQLGDDHDWYVFLNEIEDSKYELSDSEKSAIKNLVQQFRLANIEALNESLRDFFSMSADLYFQELQTV